MQLDRFAEDRSRQFEEAARLKKKLNYWCLGLGTAAGVVAGLPSFEDALTFGGAGAFAGFMIAASIAHLIEPDSGPRERLNKIAALAIVWGIIGLMAALVIFA